MGRAGTDSRIAAAVIISRLENGSLFVMAGLVPAIHAFLVYRSQDVDARDKPGHDEC
jgi:hypothetical protein